MSMLLLLLNGTLVAGLYALGHVVAQEGVSPLALLFWQASSSAAIVCALGVALGTRPPLTGRHLRYYAVAGLLGTTLPYLATYWALAHLPAGIVGIVGSLSALFTYVIARALGTEPASCVRKIGIGVGFAGVLLILLPKGALPDPDMVVWVALAAVAPVSLAAGNVYRSWGWPPGLAPLPAAGGMLAVQALGLLPLAAISEAVVIPATTTISRADGAMLAVTGVASALYVASFALQRRGGPVMVSQMGYVITVATLVLGTTLLGERYSPWVWSAVALVLVGIYLVARRPRLGSACAT